MYPGCARPSLLTQKIWLLWRSGDRGLERFRRGFSESDGLCRTPSGRGLRRPMGPRPRLLLVVVDRRLAVSDHLFDPLDHRPRVRDPLPVKGKG